MRAIGCSSACAARSDGSTGNQSPIDLDGATDAELRQYDILGILLNDVGSPLYNLTLERGIENEVEAYLVEDTAKPMFVFSMDYADPEQKDALKALAEDALIKLTNERVAAS